MTPPSLETVNRAIGLEIARSSYSYSKRDAALYALGIGAPASPLEPAELKFAYESGDDFQVLPTFAVIFAKDLIHQFLSGDVAGIRYKPMMLVHGEQELDVLKLLPPSATVTSTYKIADIMDKGSGLLMVVEVVSSDARGAMLARARTSVFIRGLGGFGGQRGASRQFGLPARRPDQVVVEKTLPQQALIYRLTGDLNPLHADPSMAAVGGYDRPILHGLCTYGFAGRALIKAFCENDARRLRGLDARFAHHVFPGETLMTEMWQRNASEIQFQTKVKERAMVVLSHGRARLKV